MSPDGRVGAPTLLERALAGSASLDLERHRLHLEEQVAARTTDLPAVQAGPCGGEAGAVRGAG